MHPLVAKLKHALGPDGDPLGVVLRKVVDNVQAVTAAKTSLRACDSVGSGARSFGRSPRIDNKGKMVLGNDVALSCKFGTVLLATGPDGELEIGDRVTINYGTSIHAAGRVKIGSGTMVGPYCVVSDTDVELADGEPPAPVEIGEDAWLACRVVVRPGAKIGARAVIAAGSIVEGEIPADAVASGAPAKVLRVRRPGKADPEAGADASKAPRGQA